MGASCSNCGARLAPDAIDSALGVGQCQMCGQVSEVWWDEPTPSADAQAVDVPREPDPFEPETPPAPMVQRERTPRGKAPGGWVEVSESPLTLQHSNGIGGTLFLLVFALFWNGMMVGGFATSPMFLCLPHTWVGIGLLYYVLVALVNRTVIEWDGATLSIANGPVPWFGGGVRDLTNLDQIYIERSSIKVNKQPRWNLLALDRSGRKHVLIRLIASTDEARWLESRLEDALGIEDRPVDGEIGRRG